MADQYEEILNNFPPFKDFETEEKESMLEEVFLRRFHNGENFSEDEGQSDPIMTSYCLHSLIIVIDGTVDILDQNGEKMGKFQKGDFFGDTFPILNKVNYKGLSVSSDSMVGLCFTEKKCKEIFQTTLGKVILRNHLQQAIQKDEFLKDLKVNEQRDLSRFLKQVLIEKGELVFEKGTVIGEKLVFLLQGNLIDEEGDNLLVQEGQFIGVKDIFEEEVINEYFQEDYIMDQNGMIMEVEKSKFLKLINRNSVHKLSGRVKNLRKMTGNSYYDISEAIELDLNEINVIKQLGGGCFGEVFLCSDAFDNQNLMAVKAINKIDNEEAQQIRIIVEVAFQHIQVSLIEREKYTQNGQASFYLVVQRVQRRQRPLLYIFKIYRRIGFVQLLKGIKQLRKIIINLIEYVMDIKTARFYISQVILCLEHLHSKNIIYRDLKPENLMIDRDGYLKLIDFGTAKLLNKDRTHRTFTLMGSLHYIAPEVLDGSGHGFEVDLFSLGVIFYELVCGSLPYGEEEKDPIKVYQTIMTQKVEFPNWIKNKPLKKLIRKLIRRNPDKRKQMTFDVIKSNETFEGLKWKNVLKKVYFAPLHPNLIGKKSEKKLENLQTEPIPFKEYFANMQKQPSQKLSIDVNIEQTLQKEEKQEEEEKIEDKETG